VARLFAEVPSAALRASIVRADAAPLRGAGGGRAALPVTFAGRVALTPKDVSIGDINASIGGATLRGKLEFTLARPHRLQGEIEADTIDGASLITAATGMPAMGSAGNKSAWVWSPEPFADGAFGAFTGQITLKARRFDLLPQLTTREFRATARVGKGEFALDDMAGEVGGGHFEGGISFRAAEAGVTARAKISLNGAAAGALFGSPARPLLSGSLALAAEVEGTGLSPVALIGSLHGSGKIGLADAQFARLDPRAFDAATRAVDQGLAINVARIGDIVSKALDSGPLAVKRAEGTIAVSAGQVGLNNIVAEGKNAGISISGNLDLTDGSIGARLVLSGPSQAAGAQPNIFVALKGPVAAPSRSIDVSALTGWPTLRAVDQQAKQLQAIENPPPSPRAAPTPGPKSEQAPALPAPIDIRPLRAPTRAKQAPASLGPQN
jgi:uncharacterized protein involved in outer membrane biogenesis